MKKKISLVLTGILMVSLFGNSIVNARGDHKKPCIKHHNAISHNHKYSEFDVNKNGIVDSKDLLIAGNAIFSLNKYDPRFDFNKDKVLNYADYSLLKSCLSSSIPASTHTPVPTSTPTPIYTQTPTHIPLPTPLISTPVILGPEYDFNKDGIVDMQDLTIVGAVDLYSGKNYYPQFDFNKDGYSDPWDYFFVEDYLYFSQPKPTPVNPPIKYDLNKDGSIDVNDLMEIYNTLVLSSAFDVNKDGAFDKNDYYYMYFHMPIKPDMTSIHEPVLEERITSLEYDFYKDGQIDANDLERLRSVMWLCIRYDTNNDNILNTDDYILLKKLIADYTPTPTP